MIEKYAPHPGHRCPKCKSPSPHLHPAMAFEGEVQLCLDAYHLIPTNQNSPKIIREIEDKRAEAAK